MKLLFVTTSLGTKWESYSQALISHGFPAQKRLVIDGTRNWWPLMFLAPALEQDSDYIIHIDEDCFLYDPDQLSRLISYLTESDDTALAGIPDGGTYYREHNPYACNLFFIVFKTSLVRELLKSNPNWMNYKFEERFKSAVNLDLSALDASRIRYDNYEPYYGFFWMILAGGKKIAYLHQELNPKLLSTDVSFDRAENPIARHMWYLRSWNVMELGPEDKIPHGERYLELEKDILSRYGGHLGFRRILLAQNMARIMKNAFRKTPRKTYALARKMWQRMGRVAG